MKRAIKTTLSALAALILIGVIIYFIGFDKFFTAIKSINPLWLIPLFLVYTIDWFIRGYRWSLILKQNDYKVPVKSATSLSLLGNFSNLVIPAKLGDLVWMYAVKKKHKVRLSVAVTSVILDRFCDFIAVIIYALVSMLMLVRMDYPQWVYNILNLGIVAVVVFFIFVFLLTKYKDLMKRIIKIRKIQSAISKVSDAFFHSTKNFSKFLGFIALSLVVWLIETLMAYAVARLLGVDISFIIILFAIIVANITKTIPLTPADIGVYEAALAAILFVSGISFEVGLTIALVDHMIKILYVLIVGSFVASSYGINISKVNKNELKA